MPTGDARDLAALAVQQDILAHGYTTPDGTLTAAPGMVPYVWIYRCVADDGTVDQDALAIAIRRYMHRTHRPNVQAKD